MAQGGGGRAVADHRQQSNRNAGVNDDTGIWAVVAEHVVSEVHRYRFDVIKPIGKGDVLEDATIACVAASGEVVITSCIDGLAIERGEWLIVGCSNGRSRHALPGVEHFTIRVVLHVACDIEVHAGAIGPEGLLGDELEVAIKGRALLTGAGELFDLNVVDLSGAVWLGGVLNEITGLNSEARGIKIHQ